MRLTSDQIRFFELFGYLHLPGAFASDIAAIIKNFEQMWADHGGGHAGKPHDHQQRSCIGAFIDRSETLSDLVDDARVDGIASPLIGDDWNYMGSDGNLYAGDTPWHSDGWNRGVVRNIKLAFYLDPLTRDSGCLRVIPGSHRIDDRYAETLQTELGTWGALGANLPAQALETRPGDVAIFDHNIKHAAFNGTGRRRMFTMNLSSRIPERLLPDLREGLKGAARFWVDEAYCGPQAPMRRKADARRLRRLEQVIDNYDLVPEATREARKDMVEPARG
ncbi:MAG: phytanoyl-CoA dioxygenase family protein [Planctomycetes bacterium]|nr:phytanoyl-CoA dioxygenase family protein [Planctomycetota bacterium]